MILAKCILPFFSKHAYYFKGDAFKPYCSAYWVFAVVVALVAHLVAVFPAVFIVVLDLCALIANATLCCASSLHARIIADAFARRAISLVGGAPQAAKLHAWLDTWYAPQRHHLAAPGNLRALTHSVLDDALAEREGQAVRLADLAEAAARTALSQLFHPIDPEDMTP